jgi:hypothetical protein
MGRYVLNSAVITNEGDFRYKKITVEEARQWINEGPYLATVGYQETIAAFALLFNHKLELNRQRITMQNQDEALIFRLDYRLNDPRLKGHTGPEFILDHLEIGILRRIA